MNRMSTFEVYLDLITSALPICARNAKGIEENILQNLLK